MGSGSLRASRPRTLTLLAAALVTSGCTPSGGADGGPSASTSLGATSTTSLAVSTATAPDQPTWIEVTTLSPGGGFTVPDYAANPSECFNPSRPSQVEGIDA